MGWFLHDSVFRFQHIRDYYQGVLVATLALWATGFAYFFYKGYHARKPFARLRRMGMVSRLSIPQNTTTFSIRFGGIDIVSSIGKWLLTMDFQKPMPDWHPILGHLLSLPPILKTLPSNAQQPEAFRRLAKTLDKKWDGTFYLDLWPFSNPLLVVTSPPLAIQSCQQHDLIKPHVLTDFFDPLAGGGNLFTMNGSEWKRSRALFNPGFNGNYILGQMQHVVEETLVYVEILREHARSRTMFSLDEVTLWFTLDIIGAVTLNSRLHSQRQYNPLASAMRSQVRWHTLDDELNPFKRWNPVRPIIQWYNSWTMNNYISTELDKRYAEFLANSSQGTSNRAASSRSAIDLAIEGYMSQQGSKNLPNKLSEEFKRWAEIQIRLFLFAGHDSTSSAICYCFYVLSKHPEVLQRLRAEHDQVFGKDIGKTADLLLEKPNLINELPYTLAIIKETLRLFPPASAMRGGRSDVDLYVGDDKLPTEGMNIWVLHHAVQRNPKYWPRPDEFLPERWLVEANDPLYPPKGGWRPFEHGPRNCIGQTLVYLDIKTVLVLTVREFDIRDAYEEWDVVNSSKHLRIVDGERAYQISQGGLHPADGFPCRVSFHSKN